MNLNTKQIVSISEANQNFSKVVRTVDESGIAVILKNNKPRYVVVDFETDNSACNAEFTRLCEINTNVIRQIVIAKPQ